VSAFVIIVFARVPVSLWGQYNTQPCTALDKLKKSLIQRAIHDRTTNRPKETEKKYKSAWMLLSNENNTSRSS